MPRWPARRTARGIARAVAVAAILIAGAFPPGPGHATSPPVGNAVRPAEPGTSPRASLDAAMRAIAAERAGDRAAALAFWKAAVDADPRALAPRLARFRLLSGTAPAAAAMEVRAAASIVTTEFLAQRWAVRHLVLGSALAVMLASVLLLLGLVARHLRALQHHVQETIAHATPLGAAAGLLAWGAFALPFAAGLGAISALLFLVFAASHRLVRRERAAALAVTAAYLVLGPALWLTGPLWTHAPSGTDSDLIAEAQRDPSSPTSRAAADLWLAGEPDSAVPEFLRGLDDLRSGDPRSAALRFRHAADSGELPPAVLETNLGSAAFLGGETQAARQHFERAVQINPGRFESCYDLGIVRATLGDYPGADDAMEAAGEADLDRLRSIGRTEHGDGPRTPVEARLSAADLWYLGLLKTWPAVPPPLLGSFFPLGNPWAVIPVTALAVALGLLSSRRLRRTLEVHVCYQCGRPICRRCLARIDRHAYCRGCGESLGGADLAETTRRLLRRLLEDRPSWPSYARPLALALLPGTGAVVAGHAAAAFGGAIIAGVGMAVLSYPSWGSGCLPIPGDPVVGPAIAPIGWFLVITATVVNALGVRAAERGAAGLRGFFERDVDRSAA